MCIKWHNAVTCDSSLLLLSLSPSFIKISVQTSHLSSPTPCTPPSDKRCNANGLEWTPADQLFADNHVLRMPAAASEIGWNAAQGALTNILNNIPFKGFCGLVLDAFTGSKFTHIPETHAAPRSQRTVSSTLNWIHTFSVCFHKAPSNCVRHTYTLGVYGSVSILIPAVFSLSKHFGYCTDGRCSQEVTHCRV